VVVALQVSVYKIVISSIKGKSFGRAKFWDLIIDDYSGYCWSCSLKQKDEFVSRCYWFDERIKKRLYFCPIEECMQFGFFFIKFEYSGHRTPQGNGKVE
jgi:hypothetical protein